VLVRSFIPLRSTRRASRPERPPGRRSCQRKGCAAFLLPVVEVPVRSTRRGSFGVGSELQLQDTAAVATPLQDRALLEPLASALERFP
jgi:hypothetical protein